MFAFLHAYQYKNEVFALADNGTIWRMRFWNPGEPEIQLLSGNEAEFHGPISVLRALEKAYV